MSVFHGFESNGSEIRLLNDRCDLSLRLAKSSFSDRTNPFSQLRMDIKWLINAAVSLRNDTWVSS
jgi:hypothetical protein